MRLGKTGREYLRKQFAIVGKNSLQDSATLEEAMDGGYRPHSGVILHTYIKTTSFKITTFHIPLDNSLGPLLLTKYLKLCRYKIVDFREMLISKYLVISI